MTSEYIEYTIKIKDEKSTLSEKEIIYEALLLSKDNEVLMQAIAQLMARFFADEESPEAPEITITAKMVYQS
jgi:hypothetical protein